MQHLSQGPLRSTSGGVSRHRTSSSTQYIFSPKNGMLLLVGIFIGILFTRLSSYFFPGPDFYATLQVLPRQQVSATTCAVDGAGLTELARRNMAHVGETSRAEYDLEFKRHGGFGNFSTENFGQVGVPTRVALEYFKPIYHCPLLSFVGPPLSGEGKWLCGIRTLISKPGCVIYSIAIHPDIELERDLLSKTECMVHVFRPSLKKSDKARIREVLGKRGLLHEGDMLKIIPSERDKYYVTDQLQRGEARLEPLNVILGLFQHQWVDLLRINLEGHEFEALYPLLGTGDLPFGQIMLEVHFFRMQQMGLGLYALLRGLQLNGAYKIVQVQPNAFCQLNCHDVLLIKTDRDSYPISSYLGYAQNREVFVLDPKILLVNAWRPEFLFSFSQLEKARVRNLEDFYQFAIRYSGMMDFFVKEVIDSFKEWFAMSGLNEL